MWYKTHVLILKMRREKLWTDLQLNIGYITLVTVTPLVNTYLERRQLSPYSDIAEPYLLCHRCTHGLALA